VAPSAVEAHSYLTLAPVIVADDAPVGAAGDAPGGAAGDAPASLEPEVSLRAECAPSHVSSSAPQLLPASPLSPMRAPSEMSAADTDMLSELMEEFGLTQGPPHDAYGKDAKHLCRTAERNQKARLASTHDVYYFLRDQPTAASLVCNGFADR
jgi:hypothetical protein